MSIEAISFAKSLDVKEPVSRLLLLIIGENTFNDTGLCKVGQKVLIDETRTSERTVRRHLRELVDKGVIKMHPKFKGNGTRDVDAIELLGFLDWLPATRSKQPVNLAGGQNAGGVPATRDRGYRPMVAGTYKESRTSTRTSNAPAREDSKSGFQKVGAFVGVVTITPADATSWKAWQEHLASIGEHALAEAAVAAGRMNVVKRFPKSDTPLPIVDKRPKAAKQLAERVVGEGVR
jgi:hypothetical protein